MKKDKAERYNVEAVKKAIDVVGSASKLARDVDVTYQTVIFWKNGKVVPNPLNCAKIERITNGIVKREDILPNYPWEELR